MKLDNRILEGKTYLDCFDTEVAKGFIGKECYLSDEVASFANIDNLNKATLKGVDDGHMRPYKLETTRRHYGAWSPFILPCEWVKPEEKPEKKYRAFSLNEFLERYKIGDTVTFRMKKDEHIPEAECLIEYKRMITGYEILPEDKDTPGKGSILLGGCPPTGLARLFEFYEIKNSYYCPAVWQPFGIIDESQE